MSKAEEAGKLAQELMYAGNNIFSCAPQVIVRIAADCAALEARVKELRDDSHDAAKSLGVALARAQKAEAELERLKAQDPVYQYQYGIENEENGEIDYWWDDCSMDFYEKELAAGCLVRKLYTEARPVAAVPVKEPILPPSPYFSVGGAESLSEYEKGEAQGRCDMWEEVKRLNAGAEVKS